MWRALLVLVVLVNGLFFAWSRGAFAPGFPPPHAGEREPERLNAQINAATVVVLPAPAASAAITAARAAALLCLEAGPLPEPALAAAEAALAAAQLPDGAWRRDAAAVPASWLVFAGKAQDGAGLRARADELKKLGLEFEIVDAPADLANGFVLSRHIDKAAADSALAAATALGLRGGKLVQLPPPAPVFWLRAPRADSDVQDKLKALPPEVLAGGFKPCLATGEAPATAAAVAASGAAAGAAAASAATPSASSAAPAAPASALARPSAAAAASVPAPPASR